jgi:tetratricopeptide (TPR) repeat protein
LTGQTLATQLLDRLRAIDADVPGLRAPSTYADNWSRDVALEIPQTGVSIGELDRTLRRWLGHQTQVTGELARDREGVILTVRAGQLAGHSFSGNEADLPALMGQAAEAIQRQTQPYRYSTWLARGGRRDEADAMAREIVREGSTSERPYGYLSLGNRSLRGDLDARAALAPYREAFRLDPRNANFAFAVAHAESIVGQDEPALAHTRDAIRLLKGGGGGIAREYVPPQLAVLRVNEALLTGNVAQASAIFEPFRGRQIVGAVVPEATLRAMILSRSHEPSAGLRVARQHIDDVTLQLRMGRRVPGDDFLQIAETQAAALSEMERWTAVLTITDPSLPILPLADAATPKEPKREQLADIAQATAAFGRQKGDVPDALFNVLPQRAYALARQGRLAEAEAEIAATPLDCYRCVRVRGRIATLKGDARAADHWFREAERMAPSIPYADTEWGEALLARGDTGAAIARLQRAHRMSPGFADPLELWGEALMRQARFAQATRKFAEAAKLAPRWGRLHLHWGEALAKLGRGGEARAKWRAAAEMDLSAADRARLDQRVLSGS